jgi:hypothetical protein
MFAEVGMRRLTADGTVIRALTDPEPATVADLQAEQLVEITPGDEGAAKRVVIAWSVPGTIVKVDADSITFRPAAADRDANAPKQDDASASSGAGAGAGAGAAAERTLKIHKDATRVTIATAGEPRPAPGGRGAMTSIDYKSGTIADLKADQSVVVCIKKNAAAKITIHVANGNS